MLILASSMRFYEIVFHIPFPYDISIFLQVLVPVGHILDTLKR